MLETGEGYNLFEVPGSTEKRDAMSLRMRREEKLAFKKAAKMAGLTLSAWMITRLRAASASEIKSAGEPDPFIHQETPKRKNQGSTQSRKNN
jgi:hypothetical protein